MPPQSKPIRPEIDEVQIIRPKKDEFERLIRELRIKVKASKFPDPIIPRLDTEFLAKFLRIKDYNVKKAHTQIKKYYHCVYVNLDLHNGVRPSMFVNAFYCDAYMLAKKENRPKGVGLVIVKATLWKPREISVYELQMSTGFLYEEYSKEIELQENGISLIADLQGVRFEHIWQVTFKEIRRIVQAVLSGYPVRIKEIHVLHVPAVVWPLYRAFKYMAKEKIHRRVTFHKNFESLYEHFDKEQLPQSFGGYLGEDEAAEKTVIERVLKNDTPFEQIWNGKYWNHMVQEL